MYDANEHEWLVANSPRSATVMAYPGMLLWGLCGFASSAAVTLALAPRLKRTLRPATLHLVGGWALTAVAVTGAYFLWGLWPF